MASQPSWSRPTFKMGGKDLEMVDVDAHHATEPSLQRLKTLDSLPDLKTQLKTASEYCNHGHRAEMIVKWLTGKMQKDGKAASNSEAWNLLEHCFRLIAPQKMSTLLARFQLLETARTSMQNLEGKKLARLLEAITKSVETLEEISSGSDGAVVKQLLSTDGPSAAALLGTWTNRVLFLLSGEDAIKHSPDEIAQLAHPAVRLWDARKPGTSDNDAFAKDCLLPCSTLLGKLSGSTSSGSNKRRRGASKGAGAGADAAHDLEILIARHVFLPGRAAFFESADKNDSEETVSELAGKLSSIKSAIEVGGGIACLDETQQQLSGASCDALPKLLDIALRCVPMTTSRQRSKERPWVEKVFQELLACLDVEGNLANHSTLPSMLKVVGKRASLPATTLKDIVSRYSRIETLERMDVVLVAEVVALDPTIFVDAALADQLFPALTTRSLQNSWTNIEMKLVLIDIARPVMRAFATSRKLEDFVLRWQQELQTVEDAERWTVWTELDDLLAELLEVHLTVEQIEKVFDTLRGAMHIPSEGKKSSKESKSDTSITQQSQRASAVVLHALCKGTKSDELIQRLQPRIGDLFDALLVLVENNKVKIISIPVWKLLALTFKLWFPAWAIKQTDEEFVSQKAQSLLSNKAIDRIVKASASGKGVELAEMFVGLLCSYLQHYDGCQDLASNIGGRLSQSSTGNETMSPVFLAFPNQLLDLSKDQRNNMINNFVRSAIGSASNGPDLTQHLQDLAAFVYSAAVSPNTKIADEAIAAVLQASEVNEDAVLDLLLETPASTLARGQRERIMNWATGLDYSSGTESQLTKRYAVMVRLMHLPNASANICTDASIIWSLCRGPSTSKKSRSGKEKSGVDGRASSKMLMLSMLEELTRLLCTYLLATQDQERSRTLLHSLVKSVLEETQSAEDLSKASYGRLVIVRTIVQHTDSAGGKSVLSQLAGESVKFLLEFSERTLKETQSSTKALKKQEDEHALVSSKALFDLLVCFRKSSAVGSKLAEDDKALVKLCNKILAKSSGDDERTKAVSGTSLLVPAFSLLVHINGFEACTSLGESLLISTLSPQDRQRLIEELKHVAKESETSEKLSVLKQVVPNAQNASAQSITILQNAVAAVSRDSISKDEQAIHTLYLTLLDTLSKTKDFATYTASISCLLTILREKPFILNQHLTEATLQAIQSLARSSPAERLVYLDLCSILSALLLHHRARLQGRFHLLTSTLQTLQTRLFMPTKPTTDSERKTLSPRHARAYTRLLTLLCNPPTRTHHNNSNANNAAGANKHNLIDESRRARAHVGQYVPTLLHSFCAQILSGTLGEGVREAMTPGLWAVIEAMEVQSPEAIKTLSSGMNNSERAVLRSVYDDWKRFGKWEGA